MLFTAMPMWPIFILRPPSEDSDLLIFAKGVTQGITDLPEGGVYRDGIQNRRQQVIVTSGGVSQCLQSRGHRRVVAPPSQRGQALPLLLLDGRVHIEAWQ